MSCEFCKKIWSSQKEYKESVGNHWEENNAIVMEDGVHRLYIPIEMDFYYSGTYMTLNFCPKCGRKLTENEDPELEKLLEKCKALYYKLQNALPDGCANAILQPMDLEDDDE